MRCPQINSYPTRLNTSVFGPKFENPSATIFINPTRFISIMNLKPIDLMFLYFDRNLCDVLFDVCDL
jgi:hypothetical protein